MPTPFTLPTAVTLTDVQTDNYRTKTFVLDARLDAYPGQFVMVWQPRFDEKPFSLVNADPVTLMITAVGPFSRLMHDKQPGDKVWLRGPFGNGFRVAQSQKRLALVGGGYGVAPLLWLACTQAHVAESVTAIVGARTAQDLLYVDRFQAHFDALHRPPSALLPATEDGSAGERGLVTQVLEPLLRAGQIDGIFACGPHGMLAALEALAQAHQVPAQLGWEAYMRCALGICGACEHHGTVLCMDGPVLASRD